MLQSSLDKVIRHIESSVNSYVATIDDASYSGKSRRYDPKNVDRNIFPYIDIRKHLNGDIELYSIEAKKLDLIQSYASSLQESYERKILDKNFKKTDIDRIAKSDEIKYKTSLGIAFFGTSFFMTYLLATRSDSNYMNNASEIFIGGIAGFFALVTELFTGAIYGILNVQNKSGMLGTNMYEEKLRNDYIKKLKA
jgi:hypothetical protein